MTVVLPSRRLTVMELAVFAVTSPEADDSAMCTVRAVKVSPLTVPSTTTREPTARSDLAALVLPSV